jgi:hypothetical protein
MKNIENEWILRSGEVVLTGKSRTATRKPVQVPIFVDHKSHIEWPVTNPGPRGEKHLRHGEGPPHTFGFIKTVLVCFLFF